MNPEVNFFLPFYLFVRLLVCLRVQKCVKPPPQFFFLSDITVVKHYFAKGTVIKVSAFHAVLGSSTLPKSISILISSSDFSISSMMFRELWLIFKESPPLLVEFRTEYDKL